MAKMMFCGCLARKPVNKNKNLVESRGKIIKSHLTKIAFQKNKKDKSIKKWDPYKTIACLHLWHFIES